MLVLAFTLAAAQVDLAQKAPPITRLDPPEDGFFVKKEDAFGIPVISADVVSDEALVEARRRMGTMLQHQPTVLQNLLDVQAEVQVIGKDQVTSDLPEFRSLKGKPFDGKLTIDQRTRGMGGRHTSCGEENLLLLKTDRYYTRDILTHEFGHCVMDYGCDDAFRAQINARYKAALAVSKWVGAYSASNPSEFFAEMSMWYFGTHGDMHMKDPKPKDGPDGLKAYDPETYAFMDDFYQGRTTISPIKWTSAEPATVTPSPNKGYDHDVLKVVNQTQRACKVTEVDPDGSSHELAIVPAGGNWVTEPDPRAQYSIQNANNSQTYRLSSPHTLITIS